MHLQSSVKVSGCHCFRAPLSFVFILLFFNHLYDCFVINFIYLWILSWICTYDGCPPINVKIETTTICSNCNALVHLPCLGISAKLAQIQSPNVKIRQIRKWTSTADWFNRIKNNTKIKGHNFTNQERGKVASTVHWVASARYAWNQSGNWKKPNYCRLLHRNCNVCISYVNVIDINDMYVNQKTER